MGLQNDFIKSERLHLPTIRTADFPWDQTMLSTRAAQPGWWPLHRSKDSWALCFGLPAQSFCKTAADPLLTLCCWVCRAGLLGSGRDGLRG